MATKQNLLRWYKVNLKVKPSLLNSFWLQWEKNKLTLKRFKHVYR